MSDPAQHERRGSVRLFWFALISSLVPFISVDIAPLCDLPNHLGRVQVLADYLNDRTYSDFYVLDPQVLPNLALDAIATPLGRVVGVTLAGQLFMLLTASLVVIGASLVAGAQNRSRGYAAGLAALGLHTISLEYGFVNYIFGLGFMLLSFAVWIRVRAAPPARRVIVSVPLTTLLFFTHLMPLAFYGVLITAYEAARLFGRNRSYERPLAAITVAGAQFLLPALLYFVFSPTRSELGRWETLAPLKKVSQLASMFAIGDGAWDIGFSIALVALAILLAMTCRPRFGRSGMLAVLAFAALFAIAPQKTATADNISIRVPTALFLVAAAFVDLRPRSRHHAVIIAVAIGSLLAARTARITFKWVDEADVYTELRAAFRQIPAGSSVFTLRDERQRREIRQTWDPPLAHAAGLALLEHPVYLPQLFANDGQQPLVVRTPSLVAMRSPRGDFLPTYRSPADFGQWIESFRQLHKARRLPARSDVKDAPACVLHVHDGGTEGLPTLDLRRVAGGRRWDLWVLEY